MNPVAWHSVDSEAALKNLQVDPRRGLESGTARLRLTENGPNALRDAEPVNPWALLLEQFKSPLVLLLLFAAFVSGFLGEWVDTSAISIIVVLNAVIGFMQEYNAERAIAALKKMTAPMARVLRGGQAVLIPAAETVPGDILLLEGGDIVAADARLLQAADLRVLEAALTGESVPSEKDAAAKLPGSAPLGDRINLVFMGTSVATGTGRALVTATGMNTEIGRIAGMLAAEPNEATPLQKQLAGFGKWALWVCLGLVAAVFLLGLLRHLPPLPMFLTSVTLAVAAVPEGLPAVVTIALALGVKRMARRHALIRRLPSVETLGAAEVICTDKTGTLTLGEMAVRELYVAGETFRLTGSGLEPEGAILHQGHAPSDSQTARLQTLAVIHTGCNNADLYQQEGKWRVSGDPTEGALLASGRKVGASPELPAGSEILREFSFDSDSKRHGVFRRLANGKIRFLVNGAPDVLLELCAHEVSPEGARPLTEEGRRRILAANAAMAEQALRVIGSAYRDFEGEAALPERSEAERELVFTGLAGIQDAPRPEAAAAIARCREAGIRVVMITGDHPRTALAIARELGLASGPEEVVTGTELDAMDEAALRERVTSASVFARVTAGHKLRIVKAWRARGVVVAMTGDGVNDAPALKASDIGIAMGRGGTEVTKQASDVVLADDNFASIVAAVEEGRGVYFNIRKSLQYLLAGNAGELIVMILPLMWGWPIPLLPVHLLWINLITDGPPALVLAADPVDGSLMRRKPRNPREKLANRPFLLSLLGTGCLTAGVSLIAFYIGLRSGDVAAARADAFDTLVLSEVFRSLAYHSEERPFWRTGWKSLRLLVPMVLGSLALQVFCHEIPVLERVLRIESWDWSSSMLMIGLSLIPLMALELRKVFIKQKHAAGFS
jgi:Ca2+-transporting ATPase